MQREERLNKIQQIFEEDLGLKWVDRLIYSHSTKVYRSAHIFDFNPGKATYVHLQNDDSKRYLARVVVDETSFIVNMNGMKINLSEHWKEIYTSQLEESFAKFR